jgi:hypothetical protein
MNISKVFSTIYNSLEDLGYARASAELQRMSDHQLLSLGLSRTKIAQGRKGLPWTIETTVIAADKTALSKNAANQARFTTESAA